MLGNYLVTCDCRLLKKGSAVSSQFVLNGEQ
jgi:hypothetical protein